jgi:superfamily II DNA or RNA helicase
MEERFGLSFAVFDRNFVQARRRERGFGVNPWTTHSRFIVSHALLRDESHTGSLRDWLDGFPVPGSLLILDEAHHAAPASGSKYAIDSILTRVIRDLSPRFEHRLFLSATPHNGHSNSFAALLELLDPQRFCRGVPVRGAKSLAPVMVRRLKQDLREALIDHFPERKVIQIDLADLQLDAPELVLPRLLAEYADLRGGRLAGERRSVQTAAALVITSLQKRLFSSMEAFARTLAVHRRAVEKHQAAQAAAGEGERDYPLLREPPGRDDERAELSENEVESEEEAQMESATVAATGSGTESSQRRERDLLDQMTALAQSARGRRDPRVKYLVDWIRQELCPGALPAWNDRRVLIFTEYTDTKRYLEQELRAAFAETDLGEERIATFHGGMGDEAREEIKQAFNADPRRHPLRILIATDAGREGVNLQNHCADLFHFDLPWNPSRLEQRNGRIDRVLQRAPEVRCYYFIFPQRSEDRVLQALVRKTETIQKELGSLALVLEPRLTRLLENPIRPSEAEDLARKIESLQAGPEDRTAIDEELEPARERREQLGRQIEELRDLLGESQHHLDLQEENFRETLSCALEILGAEPLAPIQDGGSSTVHRYRFPALDKRPGADPSWAESLDALRPQRKKDQPLWEWRKTTSPRPVVFHDPGTLDRDVVHLHLEHRLVQRLLSRFLSQGFVHDDLSRVCAVVSDDPIPRIVVLGRLSLYGSAASRLHDELLSVAARWSDSRTRREALRPYAADAERHSLDLMRKTLLTSEAALPPSSVLAGLRASIERDMSELRPHLEARGATLAAEAEEKLLARGEREASDMVQILIGQRDQIQARIQDLEKPQLRLDFNEVEKRQLEADRLHWNRRLAGIQEELKREPERIRSVYVVRARRIEPVGIIYLWPRSG